jgi:hypothetical protein
MPQPGLWRSSTPVWQTSVQRLGRGVRGLHASMHAWPGEVRANGQMVPLWPGVTSTYTCACAMKIGWTGGVVGKLMRARVRVRVRVRAVGIGIMVHAVGRWVGWFLW